MAILPSNRNLIIPGKNAIGWSYLRDMQTLEAWARQPIQQLIAGTGVTLSPASGLATDDRGNGPNPITISASGGSGITDLLNGGGMTIVSPTGPTTTISPTGYPFLQYSSASSRDVGYGTGAFASINTGSATDNTAVGYQALNSMTIAAGNTAVGSTAMQRLTSGSNNTACGSGAAFRCTTGSHNTACGSLALEFITTGSTNTAVGDSAGLFAPTTGSFNTLLGSGTSVSTGGALGRTAIGIDSTGVGAVANNDNDLVLGTTRSVVNLLNSTTGAGTAGLGTNCPAVTPGSPQGWIEIRDNAGVIGYIPYWR